MSGAVLDRERVETFRTAGPRVVGGYLARSLPNEAGLASLLPTILLLFDQGADRQAVLASTTLEADGTERSLRLVERAAFSDAMAAPVEGASP